MISPQPGAVNTVTAYFTEVSKFLEIHWTLAITRLGITGFGYNAVEVVDPDFLGVTKEF